MLRLLLVDSELELVPGEICRHPAVSSSARKRGKKAHEVLLDSTLHHSALKDLPQGERRGRPDIVHLFLLLALESVLSKRGMLEAFIHTRNDELIDIDPATRLPKSYSRFVGLIEALFADKAVPSGKRPLLRLRPHFPLQRCIQEIPHSQAVVLSQEGRGVRLAQYLQGRTDLLCLIGGFSKGEFRSDVRRAGEAISIFDQPLTAWTVASEIIVSYQNALGL
jgi:rRNA small subunit pseudouridine methyltransferase Nep1